MTDDTIDLDALESALAAATPGEWEATEYGKCRAEIDGVVCSCCLQPPDARAIVALHNAAPAMIAELRGLRAIADLADVLLISERERRNGRPETTARLAAMLQDRREGRRG